MILEVLYCGRSFYLIRYNKGPVDGTYLEAHSLFSVGIIVSGMILFRKMKTSGVAFLFRTTSEVYTKRGWSYDSVPSPLPETTIMDADCPFIMQVSTPETILQEELYRD